MTMRAGDDMDHALKGGRSGVLGRFVDRTTLLGFDYDGTLAPIVADPSRARMRERTRQLFGEVTRRYPCVVITGRRRMDAMKFLAGAEPLEVIGNHGLELDGVAAARFARRVAEWAAELDERLEAIPGLVIENKLYSLTLHYRGCPDGEAARAAGLRAAAALEDARTIGGIECLNLVPIEAPNKGDALLAACERFSCARSVYLGDDETDEDVFAMRRPGVVGIRVGASERSQADYYLRDQSEIDAFLEALLEPATVRQS